jgi:hypothetical protein
VGLRWEEIGRETREIHRLKLKRCKRVPLPIHQELFFTLEVERATADIRNQKTAF